MRTEKQGGLHALDNFRDSVGFVGPRPGYLLHPGWIHSPVVGAGTRRPGDQSARRSNQRGVTAAPRLHSAVIALHRYERKAEIGRHLFLKEWQ